MHLVRFVVWLFAIIGQLFYIWMRATLSAKAAHTPWNTVSEYFKKHQALIVFRFFIAQCFMIWWSGDPNLITSFFQSAASGLGTGVLHGILAGIAFPLNYGTAGIYGCLGDVLLDAVFTYIPVFRGKVPPLNGRRKEDIRQDDNQPKP